MDRSLVEHQPLELFSILINSKFYTTFKRKLWLKEKTFNQAVLNPDQFHISHSLNVKEKLYIKLLLILTNSTQLEEKEKALSAAELEMNALTRL